MTIRAEKDRKKLTMVSVVIPTYRRAEALANCVSSILAGTHLPSEIVIIGREGDEKTERAVVAITAAHPPVPIRSGWVSVRGHIPPVEEGCRAASRELIAILDDDVTVTPDWLGSMAPHFFDTSVGVVGGRVLLPDAPLPRAKGMPGCLSWYGKHWGNIGSVGGSASIGVDSVMEGNCMWRRSLLASLRFDPVLNFDDASMYGLDLCLQAKKRGYKVIYEPRAVAYHHPAPRAPELDREERGRRIFSYCRNYTYIILKWFPFWRRAVFLGWWYLIGEREGWGLGSFIVDNLFGSSRKKRYVAQAFRGKTEGMRLWLKS